MMKRYADDTNLVPTADKIEKSYKRWIRDWADRWGDPKLPHPDQAQLVAAGKAIESAADIFDAHIAETKKDLALYDTADLAKFTEGKKYLEDKIKILGQLIYFLDKSATSLFTHDKSAKMAGWRDWFKSWEQIQEDMPVELSETNLTLNKAKSSIVTAIDHIQAYIDTYTPGMKKKYPADAEMFTQKNAVLAEIVRGLSSALNYTDKFIKVLDLV
jgi:hypothetical protein